jgi:hypothetical protein
MDKRVEFDAYMTPSWCVRRLLEAWTPRLGLALEPAVGEGAIVKAMPKEISRWQTIDIRPVTLPAPTGIWVHRQADYLASNYLDFIEAETVITNPPFSLAEQFIRKARRECPNADLVFLLRLGFLASQERVALWRDLGEPDVLILPNRPSFTSGGTDKYDYFWAVWPPNARLHGHVSHLAETSLAERQRG